MEENDHSLSVKGVEDVHKLIGDFWNMVNNRQKVSVNILTNNMVYDQEIEGKQIVVIEVPRADRTIRPVYIGQDPMRGTYVRYGEGDHLCNRDQVAAIYRGIIDCGVHFLFRSNLVRMEVGKMKSLCI